MVIVLPNATNEIQSTEAGSKTFDDVPCSVELLAQKRNEMGID